MTKKKYSLKKIIDLKDNMSILIDDEVSVDDNGNFLVNVGYIRVSTDKQAELGYGLDIQERDIKTYCQRNEIKNLLLFSDDGYTGTNMDRPALKRITDMIKNFNEGRSNIRVNSMIISKIDRLGRTLLGTLQFIQDYIVSKADSKNSQINNNKEDINFISVSENYCRIERSNPQGKFLLMLFASLAEFDRDLIVEKLKKGRVQRVSSGKWMGGGMTPYGYKYDKEQGKLIVIPEEADKIKEVFRLYIEEKMSPNRIAQRLNFKGEKIVTQILKRKSLTGCIVYKGEEYEGEHEAIISLERWQEAQDEFEKRSVVRGNSIYLLTGLIYCGECGAKMRYQKWDKNTGECKIVCYSKQKSKPNLVKDENCENENFWQSDIEDAVISELFRLSYLNNEKNVKKDFFVNPINALSQQLANEKRKLSKLYDFDDCGEDDEILKEKILNCRKKIKDIQNQIEIENEQTKIKRKIDKAEKVLRTLKSSWEYMSQKEKQSVCKELIDKIIVYKNGTIDVFLRLESYVTNQK